MGTIEEWLSAETGSQHLCDSCFNLSVNQEGQPFYMHCADFGNL